MIWYLIISLLALAIGPILFKFKNNHQFAPHFLDSFALTSVFGLALFHLLPESISHGGIWAILAACVGLFGPMLFSSYFKTGECHIQKSILSMAFLGLMAHATFDGLAIAGNNDIASQTSILALSIILHRLPVSVGIYRVANQSGSNKLGLLTLLAIGIATIVGYFFGTEIITKVSEQTLIIFQALMAGTLLHVFFHKHHIKTDDAECKPHKHKWQIGTGLGAIVGVLVVVVLLLTHSQTHHHRHSGGHTHHHHQH